MKIVISSGHGKYIRGASGIIDEVDEARLVVNATAEYLKDLKVEVITYEDNISDDQSENLNRIVDFHNAQGPHDLDVSVHFNAYEPTEKPMGCEVLFLTADILAEDLSATMAHAASFINRGPKYRDDLFFLNQTLAPSVLLEICFVDSAADVDLYNKHFDEICMAIATTLAGRSFGDEMPEPPTPDIRVLFSGKCSHFGGPGDTGVDPDEGLAFFYEYDDAPHLFLPQQPSGTTGLARRLDPSKPYVACRWDYDITPKTMLADPTLRALVRNPKTKLQAVAWPADWGPHEDTDRVADLSPGLMQLLGLSTDDEVEVLYPAPILIMAEDA